MRALRFLELVPLENTVKGLSIPDFSTAPGKTEDGGSKGGCLSRPGAMRSSLKPHPDTWRPYPRLRKRYSQCWRPARKNLGRYPSSRFTIAFVSKASNERATGYFVAVLGVALATVALKSFIGHINSTTVALALLLIVLLVAARWGSRPALLASALGMVCFNFFFLPPVWTLAIATPDNWIALAAFLITAITAGQLSVREKRRAEEAEAGQAALHPHRAVGRLSLQRGREVKGLEVMGDGG